MQDSLDHGIGVSEKRVAVTEHVRTNLEIAANWGRFVALGGFFLSVFIFLMALVWLKLGLSSPYSRSFHFTRAVVATFIAIILFLPGLHVQRFSKNIRLSLKNDDLADFEVGMEYLKSFFRLSGLYAIVLIAIILLMFGWFIYVQLILS